MSSLIFRTAARYLLPVMLLYSVFLLFRGHQEPGGGFIAGLIAAASVAICGLAYDMHTARRLLHVEPHQLIGVGLLCAIAAGLIGTLSGQGFLTGRWAKPTLPVIGTLELGSPLLFDFGVYLVVIGVVLMILVTLAEE